MIKRKYYNECHEYLDQYKSDSTTPTLNLMRPASLCPQCKQKIAWWDNIVLISYLLLRGRCRFCRSKFGCRYFFVELLTIICSTIIVWRFGFSFTGVAALLFTWSLIALSFIDITHLILPDEITIPLLWFGLFLSCFNLFINSENSILGALLGYGFFFIIDKIYFLFTSKHSIGQGDFKLLACMGAWLGWENILLVVLLSSIIGSLIGTIIIILNPAKRRDRTIPFGPFIAFGGWCILIWGVELNSLYYAALGFN